MHLHVLALKRVAGEPDVAQDLCEIGARVDAERVGGVAPQRAHRVAAVRVRAVRHHQAGGAAQHGQVHAVHRLREQLLEEGADVTTGPVAADNGRRDAGRRESDGLQSHDLADAIEGVAPEAARPNEGVYVAQGAVSQREPVPSSGG